MTRSVTIEWEPGPQPVSGALRIGALPPHPFTGWLELLSLLQTELTARADDSATTPEEGP